MTRILYVSIVGSLIYAMVYTRHGIFQTIDMVVGTCIIFVKDTGKQ